MNFGDNALTASQIAGQIGAHAFAGGVLASLNGAKFSHGFISAGITKGIGTPLNDRAGNQVVAGTLVSATIGGTTSSIVGGKFANGAVTGAFQALFNNYKLSRREQAFLAREIRRDVTSRVRDLRKWNRNKDWDSVRMEYPALAHVPDHYMDSHVTNYLLQLKGYTHKVIGVEVSGRAQALNDALAGLTVDVAATKNMPKGFSRIIGIATLSPTPPPIKHKFVFEYERIILDFEARGGR